MWQRDFSLGIAATPAAVWRLFADVDGWTAWNAGIERIAIHGPFAAGTAFEMQPPGQEPFTSTLVEVRENELFEDETVVGDIRVRVAHRIEAQAAGCRVTYSACVWGPGEAEVGEMITADFPEVLKALAALAERQDEGAESAA